MSIQAVSLRNDSQILNANQNPDEACFKAVQSKDTQKLKEALLNGANPNALVKLNHEVAQLIVNELADEDQGILDYLFHKEYFHALFDYLEVPILVFATFMCDLEAISLLIDQGADIHYRLNVRGVELFPLTLESLDTGKILAVAELLHEKGVPIEDMLGGDYKSPVELLEKAYEEENGELVQFLENKGYKLPANISLGQEENNVEFVEVSESGNCELPPLMVSEYAPNSIEFVPLSENTDYELPELEVK
jgi:hypothetical protein